MAHRLSKSRFVAGVQCHKLLWWKLHEPDAVELQPDKVLQDLFDQGREVGELATKQFPAGVLIDLPHTEVEERVRRTREAIDSGTPTVFEASFFEHDTFVAVDILELTPGGAHLIEVKSSTSQKPEHIPDVAVQLHVLGAAGIEVTEASVMHLNPDFRSPDVGERFTATDVMEEVSAQLEEVGDALDEQLNMVSGDLPQAQIGAHCNDPRRCPFMDRCWPTDRDHISRLYNVGPTRAAKYMSQGIHWIKEIPAAQQLSDAARRQIRALRDDRLIVEPGLATALQEFSGTLGFLDLETIFRAIPPWPGLRPWGQAAAQFSYHEGQADGSYTHAAWLAQGPQDARPVLARAMIEATRGADRVVTYSPFEKTRIRALQDAVPELRAELADLESRLIDLLPVVRDFVYHPDFDGSFSIKHVLKPLVPELGYDDLVIVDGRVASVEIARLLFVSGKIPAHEHDRVRKDLLNYCERDTWAMVRLLESLRTLASIES